MFFLLPVGVEYQARRQPIVTFTLMGTCVLVYLVTLFLGLSGGGTDVDEWVYGNLWLTPVESHWWTYLTSMFVHEGFFHLAGNMVYLYLFGACVEDLIGRVHFTFFYLLSGIVSAFAYIAVSPDHFASEIPLGGASGAISACIGGFLLLLAKTKIEFKWVFFLMFRVWSGEFMVPAWVVISLWFLEDLAMMILTVLADHRGGGVAFAAHVGGTVFGLGLMAVEKLRLKDELEGDDEEMEEPKLAQVPVRPVLQARVRPAAVPAVAEIPTISLHFNEAQCGPFSPSQIQKMFVAGEIPAGALYWQEGMDEWRTVDELRAPGGG